MLQMIGAIALVFTFLSACAHAETSASVRPALYVIRDADSTLYLFGSVHVRPRGMDWGGPDAHAALAASEEVWTELDISPAADMAAREIAHRYMTAPEGSPLSSQLDADSRTRLANLTQRLGIQPAILEAMRPWAAAMTLTLVPIIRAGYDPQSGVDRGVVAEAQGKRMRWFETAEQQIGFLANLSPELQRQMLLEAIDEAEEGPDLLRRMDEAWASGDVDMLEDLVIDDTRENYPELYRTLFVARNAAWMTTLTEELNGAGTDFVVVGAGHLLGSDGLVEQFRARGIEVERVN